MKKLTEFAIDILEQRGRPRKNADKDVNIKDVEGKKPDEYGNSELEWSVDEPKDDTAQRVKIPKEEMTKNIRHLKMKFDTKKPFFIEGRAGWGKTSIIKSLADKYGLRVLTVYLDKAMKEDIGGIPVPTKGKTGAVQEMALPAWAKVMQDNPKQQFLLFFDEMNQADPGIMNALMPIVQEHEIAGVKFDNFFVGAAGNLEEENQLGISQLSGPLKSRFKPIIKWSTGTDEDWKAAFGHLHKKWDDKIGKDFVQLFEDNATLFENPREVEEKVIDVVYQLKKNGSYEDYETEDYLDMLEGLVKEELTRHEQAQVKQLADDIYSKLNKKEEKTGGRRSGGSGKDINMIPEEIKDAIRKAIKQGFIIDTQRNNKKYGVSRENIAACFEDENLNAEMLERIINKFEADGIKFKFETNDQWKKAGYADPEAAEDDDDKFGY